MTQVKNYDNIIAKAMDCTVYPAGSMGYSVQSSTSGEMYLVTNDTNKETGEMGLNCTCTFGTYNPNMGPGKNYCSHALAVEMAR